MWTPSPADIVTLRDNGTADMGSLSFGSGGDENDKARFTLRKGIFVLVSIRCHFANGTGDADCVINLDSGSGPVYDTKLLTIKDVGTDGDDMHVRIPPDQLSQWRFNGEEGDVLVLTWTNPDTGVMSWGAEVLLAPVVEDVNV